MLECPPGFSTIVTDDGMGCSPWVPPPVLNCPPFFHVFGERPYCAPDRPPPFCPPGFRPFRHDDALTCVRIGELPPGCPIGAHPDWNGRGYVCVGNPPPSSNCDNGKPDWRDGRWTCVGAPPPRCPGGQVSKWAGGREVCGVLTLFPGGAHCPRDFVPSGPGGTVCTPARGKPILGLKAPVIPGNGKLHCLAGTAGCPPLTFVAPTLPCPTGETRGPKGCEKPVLKLEENPKLKLEEKPKPKLEEKPRPKFEEKPKVNLEEKRKFEREPIVKPTPLVVRPLVPRVVVRPAPPPPHSVVNKTPRHCGAVGEPKC